MPIEIERKFKLFSLPKEIQLTNKQRIYQGYIALVKNGTEVRVRKYGEKYSLTIKSIGDIKRKEIETSITPQQFKELWPLTKGKRIVKDRYKVKLNDSIIEIDIYHGKHKNLIVAEIEFKSKKESSKFIPPAWLGTEVTSQMKYKNRNLAV